VPGLPFIAEDIAPTAPGGADAAIGDFHHPDAEEIRPGLHAVLPGAAAGGIAGFEGDAEVEHGLVKKTFVYLTIPRHPNFGPFFLAFRGKKALKEIKVRNWTLAKREEKQS
jgi:hypothetical protein